MNGFINTSGWKEYSLLAILSIFLGFHYRLPEVDLSDLMTAKQESLEDDVLGNNNQKVSADKESDVFAQVAGIMDSLDLSSDSVAPKATLEEFVIEPRTGFKFPSLLIPNWSEEGSNHIPSAQVMDRFPSLSLCGYNKPDLTRFWLIVYRL
jgi:hypothetical protein